jgi:Fe-S-cluster-containing hydrogenase component 2
MIRKIIEIDEEKCDGCGLCIPACPEGALKLVNGKAKLVKDFYCDGMGACLGHCPQGAIRVIEREAEDYDESRVIENVMSQGEAVVQQHLEHLRTNGDEESVQQALKILQKKGLPVKRTQNSPVFRQCPGSATQSFQKTENQQDNSIEDISSELTHWPIQMHLISPHAPQYREADLLLAADCVAFSLGDFHRKYLANRKLVIACPKLDRGQEIYSEKLRMLIEDAGIKSLTVMVMQVPCCSGLVHLAKTALEQTQSKVPLQVVVVGVKGQILDQIRVS